MSATLQSNDTALVNDAARRALAEGERAAEYAARQMTLYLAVYESWRSEWKEIAAQNQIIRDSLKPALPVADAPIRMEIV